MNDHTPASWDFLRPVRDQRRRCVATGLSICLFTVPGVIIGGQPGSRVASRIPQHIPVTALTLGQVIL